MGQKSFTLFEIHLHEPSFNAPESGPRFFGTGSDDEEESDDDYQSIEVGDEEAEGDDAADDDSEESGRRVGGGAALGLLLLVALAVAVKVLTGSDSDLDELDDLADVAVGSEDEKGESAALEEE